jgi:hypothetical protein
VGVPDVKQGARDEHRKVQEAADPVFDGVNIAAMAARNGAVGRLLGLGTADGSEKRFIWQRYFAAVFVAVEDDAGLINLIGPDSLRKRWMQQGGGVRG